jgi:hypothetical protein
MGSLLRKLLPHLLVIYYTNTATEQDITIVLGYSLPTPQQSTVHIVLYEQNIPVNQVREQIFLTKKISNRRPLKWTCHKIFDSHGPLRVLLPQFEFFENSN